MKLNLEEGKAERDKAIRQVDKAANAAFKNAAMDAVTRMAAKNVEFLVDDVWVEMGANAPETHERRAMGAVIIKARRAGIIRPTGAMRASAQKHCHANPRTVWGPAGT